jgi:hypothetical protein
MSILRTLKPIAIMLAALLRRGLVATCSKKLGRYPVLFCSYWRLLVLSGSSRMPVPSNFVEGVT